MLFKAKRSAYIAARETFIVAITSVLGEATMPRLAWHAVVGPMIEEGQY